MSVPDLPRLGSCPACNADIVTTDAIIEYESKGQPKVYAECARCHDVVNPE